MRQNVCVWKQFFPYFFVFSSDVFYINIINDNNKFKNDWTKEARCYGSVNVRVLLYSCPDVHIADTIFR